MSQGGSTLLYTGEPHWWTETTRYGFPGTTKDCRDAAVASHPGLHHNSNIVSGKLPNRSYIMAPELVGAGPRRPSPNTSANYILDTMSGPQHLGEGLSTSREQGRLIHPLPQRPMAYRHKSPADPTMMERREVCRNFLAKRCARGDACHRQHILEGDDIRKTSASFPTNPEHVVQTTIPISSPPPRTATRVDSPTISSSIRIVNGLYIDRFSRQHALSPDGPSTALPSLPPIDKQSEESLQRSNSRVQVVAPPSQNPGHEAHRHPSLIYQTSPLPSPPHAQSPRSSAMLPPSTMDAGAVSSSSVHYPARLVEEDTRPARRFDEVCRLYQTGLCPYREQCYRTHTLELPIQVTTFTSGKERVKKPALAPLPTHIGGVELCKLNLAGKCTRGNTCHYSHDVKLPIRPQSRPPSPGPSKAAETVSDVAAPSQRAGLSIDKPPSPLTTGQLPLAAAQPPASEPSQKAFVNLPGNVCRMYFFKRLCNFQSCRYRHCSPEETQAFREASLATAPSEDKSEAPAPVEPSESVQQDNPTPKVVDDERESEHAQSLGNASAEENDGSVREGSPRPPNTSKRRNKSRKKSGKGGEATDELGTDDAAVVVKAEQKVVEEVNITEDKGKTKTRAKTKSVVANEKSPATNEKSAVKDKRGAHHQRMDDGGKASSGTKAPDAGVKHEKSKDKDDHHKIKDEKGKVKGDKSKVKDETCKDTDEKSKGKGKGKGKEKGKETGKRREKGKSPTDVASPTIGPSVPQPFPSPVGSEAAQTSKSAMQSPPAGPCPSQRACVPRAHAAGTSNQGTSARTVESPGGGGGTDVEESDSSYYTPGSGTISAQSSWSSRGEGSSVSTVQVKFCIDFVRGCCNRQYCRFSHDAPSSPHPGAHPKPQSVHHGSSSGTGNANVAYNREVPSVPLSAVGPAPRRDTRTQLDPIQKPRTPPPRTIASSTGLAQQASGGSSSEPLVPPGLGLDAGVIANAGKPQQGQDAEEVVTITVLDSTKVTFSSGFRIIQVNTGFDSRQVLLENLPSSVVPADLKSALSSFGDITTVLAVDSDEDDSFAYRVSFSRAESAFDAAEALNGSQLFGSTVKAQITARKSTGIGGGTLHDGDVLFEIPTARQKGYVGYETLEKAQNAIALATQKGMKGMRVTATIYEGIPVVGNVNVRFENLPADATAKDLGRYGTFETHMVDRPKYHWTVNVAAHGLRRMLETHGEVSLNVLPPPYGKYFRVWAHFKDPQAAASAHEALNRFCPRFVGKQRIFSHHVRSIRYNLPADIYDILAYDINLLRSFHHDEHATSISVLDRRVIAPGAPVLVKLVSRNMTSLTKLKTAFDRLLRGEKVTDKGQIVWNDFFGGRTGKAFLDELETVHPTVKINRDSRRRTLALFGPQQDRAAVRAEIIARAKLLEAQHKRRYTIAGNLIGVFMSEDLVILQRDLGHGNVWIDLTHGQLVVCGDADTQKVARLAVQHAGKRCKKRNARGEVGCPVCLGEVSQPVTLACGHTWCRACLTGYMNASVDNKTFPLTCLGDDAKCSHDIPLSIAQQFLSPDEFDAVVNASFLAYVQSRPGEFHYCPTPDCPQVYRKSGHRATALQCPSCLVRICAHCNMEYHESRSCQDRNPEDERLFETWKMGRDVKDCPSCKVPIERMAGCNHMTCTGCHTHICWACLATFETSGEVYGHMRTIHGGIGL